MGKEAEPAKKSKLRSWRQIFQESREVEVLFIQPPLMMSVMPEQVSPAQLAYDLAMGQVGKLLGDSPLEPHGGVLSLCSVLKERGWEVDFLDFHFLDHFLREEESRPVRFQDVAEVLQRVKARVFAITCMTVQEEWVRQIATFLKELDPTAAVVVGGTHPTFMARRLLDECPSIDVVVRGEGEVTLPELVRKLQRGEALETVLGITFRERDKGIVRTELRPLLSPEELDRLPYPLYSLLPREVFPLSLRVSGARGCIGRCDFCVPNKLFRGKLRTRKASAVVDEIEWVRSQFGSDPILLGELCFLDQGLCREILRRGLEFRWWAQTRADAFHRGHLDPQLLREAGCRMLAIGVESGSEGQLLAANKGICPDQSRAALVRLKEVGIATQAYLMLGLPFETHSSARETLRLLDRWLAMGILDLPHLSLSMPFPGTPFFAAPHRYGYKILHRNFSEYYMGCDFLGAGKPPYETLELSSNDIFALLVNGWEISASRLQKRAVEAKVRKIVEEIENLGRKVA